MTDLIHLMSRLVTPQGDILIPGVEELVAPLAPGEKYVHPSHVTTSVLLTPMLYLPPY